MTKSLSEAWQEFEVEMVALRGRAKSTLKHYRTAKNAMTRIGVVDLESLQSAIIAFASTWQGKPSSLNFYLDALGSFSKWAVDKGYLSRDPFRGFVRKRPEIGPPRALRWSEAITQIDNIQGGALAVRDRFFMFFLLYTGARANEALDVQLDMLDIDSGRVTLTKTKSRKPRSVWLPPAFKEEFRQWLETRKLLWPKATYLFPSKSGARLNYESVSNIPIKYGLDITLHQLRHTFCTQLLKQTGDLRLVQELAGHQNIATTTRYLLVTDEDKQRAAVAIVGDETQRVDKRGKRVA